MLIYHVYEDKSLGFLLYIDTQLCKRLSIKSVYVIRVCSLITSWLLKPINHNILVSLLFLVIAFIRIIYLLNLLVRDQHGVKPLRLFMELG